MKNGNSTFNRRNFLKFIGKSAIAVPIVGLTNNSCSSNTKTATKESSTILGIKPVSPLLSDDLLFSENITFYPLIKRGDSIGKDLYFGDNNDFTCVLPKTSHRNSDFFLWVNHEYPQMKELKEEFGTEKITKEMTEAAKKRVGASLLDLKWDKNKKLKVDLNSKYNKRFDAFTEIPIQSSHAIQGKNKAKGTFGNCSGGKTPWGSFLSCEENHDSFIGEVEIDSINKTRKVFTDTEYGWTDYDSYTPEHYGWVVEHNPKTNMTKKLTSLGRFSHEGALVVKTKENKIVVYLGDDRDNEFIYKFISNSSSSLDEGELFVADTKNGKWLSLSYDKSPLLKKNFEDQLDVLIQTRKAAKLLGATPQDRPEGIAISPITNEIFISCTNNRSQNRPYGKILKIKEKNNNHLSLEFNSSDYVIGASELNFACPDNLTFDHLGNLWCTTDVSGKSLGKSPYEPMGCNALYMIPTQGEYAGSPIRVGNAPLGAEFTGPCFVNSHTLLLSLQHPGENQTQKSKWDSQVLVLDLSNIY